MSEIEFKLNRPIGPALKQTKRLTAGLLFNSLSPQERHLFHMWRKINKNNPTLKTRPKLVTAGLNYIYSASERSDSIRALNNSGKIVAKTAREFLAALEGTYTPPECRPNHVLNPKNKGKNNVQAKV